MAKIITDEKLIDEFLERGVAEIFPGKNEFKKILMSGKRLRVYGGFDPSAPSLQIGNAVLINKLSQFQALGHEVIFLVGDFTGMIGDPTDKTAARKKLTREDVKKNSKDYKKQAAGYLKFTGDNPAVVMHNSKWSDKMSFKDLIELSSNFTVQQMIQRDMFQKRMEERKPIYLHEFLYPLAQGYDSVAMDVDVEVGGNDQMFNMLCGRDLMKTLKGKEKFVLTMKLLADENGKKVGKTEGNAIFLNETPENIYGQIMAWSDGLIGAGFELCTQVSYEKVKEVYRKLKNPETNPRDLKMELAFEITKINHGEKKAKAAEDYFIKTIQKKEAPDKIKEISISGGEKLIDMIVGEKMAGSKADARRKIEQGGVSIDGEVIKDFQMVLDKSYSGKVLKVGKKDFRKFL